MLSHGLCLGAGLVRVVILGALVVGPIDYVLRTIVFDLDRTWAESFYFGGELGFIVWVGDRVRDRCRRRPVRR